MFMLQCLIQKTEAVPLVRGQAEAKPFLHFAIVAETQI